MYNFYHITHKTILMSEKAKNRNGFGKDVDL